MKHTILTRTYISILLILIITVALILLPTGFESALQFKDAVKCRALILETDESRIIDTGIIRIGQQVCQVKFLSGDFKGAQAEGWNLLTGSLATDKIFHKGDKVQCVVHHDGDEIISVNLIDYYRLHSELILAILFAAFLIVFARSIGARSVLSFALTVLILWKVMVPLFLKGAPPVATGLLVTAILTFIILFLVYGFDKRLLASFGGAMLGVCFSAFLSVICTKLFKIHGAVMSYSEPLFYSGFINLNLPIFLFIL